MLSVSTLGAQNSNLGPELLSKMVRNAVKFIFIRKMREKSRRGSGVLGLLLVKSEFGVAKSEKRVTAIFLLPVWPLEPPGRSFLPYSGLYCRSIEH